MRKHLHGTFNPTTRTMSRGYQRKTDGCHRFSAGKGTSRSLLYSQCILWKLQPPVGLDAEDNTSPTFEG